MFNLHSGGSIVVSGGLLYEMYGSSIKYYGDETDRIVFDDQSYFRARNFSGNNTNWKLVFNPGFKYLNLDRGSTTQIDPRTSFHRWVGPTELNTMVKLKNENATSKHYDGFTFAGVVSGEGGITTDSSLAAQYQSDIILHLENDNNSFSGGVHLDYATLWLSSGEALPKNGAPLELGKGATLYFASIIDDYDLPKIEVDGDATISSIQYTAGGNIAAIEKTGDGNLDFGAYSFNVDSLDVQGGTFTMPAQSRRAVAGLYGGVDTNTSGTAAQSYFEDRSTITNGVTMKAEGAYYNGAGNGGWKQNVDFTYEGYIWNTNTTDVTWTFAMNIDSGYRLFIDNVEVLTYTGKRWCPTCANVTLSPGPHPIEVRMVKNGGGYMGAVADISQALESDWVWKANMGLMYDPQGRGSHNYADYIIPVDDGSGSLFTVETDLSTLAQYLPKFGTMKFAAGTTLDMSEQTYSAAAFEGLPTVTNCVALSLTNDWTVSLADVAANAKMTVDGKLKFGANSRLVLKDEQKLSGDYTLVTAAEEIEGMPTLVEPVEAHRNYRVATSDDGKSLILKIAGPGIVIMVN